MKFYFLLTEINISISNYFFLFISFIIRQNEVFLMSFFKYFLNIIIITLLFSVLLSFFSGQDPELNPLFFFVLFRNIFQQLLFQIIICSILYFIQIFVYIFILFSSFFVYFCYIFACFLLILLFIYR